MDQQAEQQAPPPPQPPQPKLLRIGNHNLTAEQIAECVDPRCRGCHGTGFRRRDKRRSTCVCLLRAIAVRYGDAEDRRRFGVSTPAEAVSHELGKRANWSANKAHHLGGRIKELEAQERELVQQADAAVNALKDERGKVAAIIARHNEAIQCLLGLEASLQEQIEQARRELRKLENQAADAFASREEAVLLVALRERDLAAIDTQTATATAPFDSELASVRKDLEKVRRRLGIHVAHNGAVS